MTARDDDEPAGRPVPAGAVAADGQAVVACWPYVRPKLKFGAHARWRLVYGINVKAQARLA